MNRPSPEDLATRPIMNRNPDSRPNWTPLSVPTYEPMILDGDADWEVGTNWTPYTGHVHPEIFWFGWDPLSLNRGHGLMHVAQADLYDASPNPWPNNGQFDHPNSLALSPAAIPRIPRESSAHHGFMQPTGGGPTMLFHAPPIFGLQTKPIPAVGV